MTTNIFAELFCLFASLILAPLLPGIINRIKALFAGRQGVPTLQLYWDLSKLLRKGFIYSKTTGWIFRIGPMIGLAAILTIALITPTLIPTSFISFQGDIFLFIYLLGIIRFFLIVSALDTGSSFEGMGSAREAFFAAIAEPAIFLCLISWVLIKKTYSLQGILNITSFEINNYSVTLVLTLFAFFIIILLESCRIPFDDPNTHLELTMIHEVMILDHSSFDLALLLYTSALKLWLLSSIVVHLIIPLSELNIFAQIGTTLIGIFTVGIIVGVIESIMARLRMNKVHHLLVGSAILATLGLILIIG